MGAYNQQILVSPSWRRRHDALTAWLAEHAAALTAGRAVVLVANATVARQLNLALAQQHGRLFPLPVRDLGDLASEVAARGGRILEVVAGHELTGYVSAALGSSDARLVRYADYADRPRTCRALADLLGRLRHEEPDPAAWPARWSAVVPHRQADLLALSALAARVDQLLAEHGRLTAAERYRLAADLVRPGCLGDVEALLAYQPTNLGTAERRLLTALLTSAGCTERTVILPGESDETRDRYPGLRATMTELVQAGLTVTHLGADGLVSRLFGDGGERVAAPVRSVVVPTPTRGVTRALREVKQARLSGVPAEQLALVVPDLPAWAAVVRAEAQRLGLPVVVLAPRPADEGSRTPVLLALLDLVSRRFPRAATLCWLGLSAKRAGLTGVERRALGQVSRQAGVTGGDWPEWQRELVQLARLRELDWERVPRFDQTAWQTASAAVDRLAALFGELTPAHPRVWRRRYAEWLHWLLGASQRSDDELADEPADPLVRLVSLDGWPPETHLDREQYAALATALLSQDLGPDRPQPGCVLVAGSLDEVGQAPRTLYLLNPIDGVLPPRLPASVPLDADDLVAMGVAPPPGEDGWGAGAALLADLVSAADELVLVEPRLADDGQPALRSPLLDELAAAAEPWPVATAPASARWVAPAAALSRDEWLAAMVRAERGGEGLDEVLARAQVELARDLGRGGRFDGDLSGTPVADDVAARFAASVALPPTRLEEYHAWPFASFLRAGLRLDEDEEPTGRLDPLAEGTLMHLLLGAAFRHGVPDDAAAVVAAVVAEQFGDDRRQPGLAPGLWRSAVGRLARWAGRLAEADGELGRAWPSPRAPLDLERWFGTGDDEPPVIGEEPFVVRLKGRADRVDRAGDGLVIIDYKRTVHGKPAKLDEARPSYQLPAYAIAAAQRHGRPVVGWALVSYREPSRPEGSAMTPEAVAERVASATAAMLADADGLRAGRFAAWPAPTGRWADWRALALARVLGRAPVEEGADE